MFRHAYGSEVRPKPSGIDEVLLNFSSADGDGRKVSIPWTIRDAVQGTLIFGKSGSGKTSGPGDAISAALLKAGFGGLVMCVKSEEAKDWIARAKAAGRESDVVRIAPEAPHKVNLLEHIASQDDAHTENILEFLCQLGEAAAGSDRKNDEWQDFMRTTLRNAIDLIRLSGASLQIRSILEIVQQNRASERMLIRANERDDLTESQRSDLAICSDYWQRQWREMAPETRTGIEANLFSFCDPLSRGVLRDLLGESTTIEPESVFDGKILIVDLPVKTFYKVGRLANVAWKLAIQRAVERRGLVGQKRPVFLYADEFQEFVTSGDAGYALTARSAGGITVFLTQAISGLWLALGGREKGRAPTDILFGNLGTKIFCCNDDRETNRYARELIGRKIHHRLSDSRNQTYAHQGGGGGSGVSRSEQMDFILEENYFQCLASGGPRTNYVVTALLYLQGRELMPGQRFCNVAFPQSEI